MCRKLVCWTILVLTVGLVSNASAIPAPVGWWKFDEGTGSDANDSSGNGNDGTISDEGVSWVLGLVGPYALDFTGGVVIIPDAPELRPSTVTACAWINLSASQEAGARVLQKGDDNHETYVFQGGGYGMNFTLLDTGLNNHGVNLARPLWQGEWIHIAGTYDGSNIIIYVNGEPNNSTVAGSFTPYQSVGEVLHIGARSAGGDRPWNGMIDDVRVYNTGLLASEIQHIYWQVRDPNYAENPNPEDEAEDVFPDVVLSWTAGFDAASHDVYFGTDFEDVNSATDPNVLPGRGRQSDTSYDPSPAGILELGETYYWRIDEANGPSVYTGDVWLFTVDDGKASNASPGNNELCVPTDANLSWTPGVLATSHDVYFGPTISDVNDSATPVSAGQAETSYELDPLEENTVYYWRVDEHGATTYAKGNIWNFRTESKLCLKVDLALPGCPDTSTIVPGTAKPGWWPWVANRWADMYMHDAVWERGENGQGPPPDTNGVAGSGVHVAITCGTEGNGGFHVHGMCRDNLGGGGCPTGAPDGDPIANGWFHNIDWGGEKTGDILMRINGLPPGEYVLISYHNHWEPCSQGTRNCLSCTSRMPNMPRVSAQSLPSDSLGYKFGFELGTGMGVTLLQDACDVDVSCVTSDDDVSTSTISFHTDGSDVLVIYDGGDNTYPDPARPEREGSKGILNAFQIALIRGDEIAWGPSPRDGAEDISPNVVLGWGVGETTISHDVYFGSDWDDVNDANKFSTEYKGSQILEADTHDPCDLLEFDETYYWRIDEVNELSDVYKGKVWSFTIYSAKASDPSPTNRAEDVARDVELSWSHSFPAASHDVYFGTDWDDVNDANKSSSEYKGSQNLEDDTYDPCGPLGLNKTYYWRIDEVNDTNVWKGDVWHFRTINYAVVDDMEDYDEIWEGWYYGSDILSNSELFLWKTAPLRGNQTMKFQYDNTIPFDPISGLWYFSEAETIDLEPNDWTAYDVRVLSLWFYGESDNTATGVEPMFLAVEDYNNVYVELRYGDGEDEDANDITIEQWQEWTILLSSLNDANLASLRALFIRFGEERFWPFPGGYGEVYFDDIRLYASLCRPDKGQPKGDLNNDCTVDFEDVEIMAGEWLESDVFVEVKEPCDANLVGWWKLDEGSGSTAVDSSGKTHHGTLEVLDVGVSWTTAAYDGNALEFSGGRVRVPDAQDLRPLDQVGVSAWINYSQPQNNARVVAKGSNDFETYDLEVNGYRLVFLVRDGGDMDDGKYKDYRTESTWDIDRDEWVHVAGTYDGNAVKCYINGEVGGTNNEANTLIFLSQNTDDLAIGSQPDGDENPFEGMIDDVRVYDYGLSAEEVTWLATDGTGIFAVQSIANVYNEEDLGKRAVNFRDFAVIADSWLETQRWPE